MTRTKPLTAQEIKRIHRPKRLLRHKLKPEILFTDGTSTSGRKFVRSDWEVNHIIVEKAFFKLVKKFNRAPSTTQIAEITGLSRNAINEHLRLLDIAEMRHTTRIFIRNVISAQARRALAGKREDVELYLAFNF